MKTPERDLKNIRIVLKSKIPEFAKSIAISEEELIKIENGERTLTDSELYIICSLLLNIMDSMVSSKNSIKQQLDEEAKIRLERNKTLIFRMLSDFILDYNPINKEQTNAKKKIFTK